MKTADRSSFALIVLLGLVVLLAPAALAGKGGNGGGPGGGDTGGGADTSIDQPAPYRYGQEITVTTNAPSTSGTWIDLACYQGGEKVLVTTHAGFPEGWYYGWPFKLGPTQMWTGGEQTASSSSGTRAGTSASSMRGRRSSSTAEHRPDPNAQRPRRCRGLSRARSMVSRG